MKTLEECVQNGSGSGGSSRLLSDSGFLTKYVLRNDNSLATSATLNTILMSTERLGKIAEKCIGRRVLSRIQTCPK
jgi:hypothetical protein